jgi:hypothetical protein
LKRFETFKRLFRKFFGDYQQLKAIFLKSETSKKTKNYKFIPVFIGFLDYRSEFLRKFQEYSMLSPETPDMPLPVQCNQRLSLLQLIPAPSARIRINIVQILWPLGGLLVGLLGRRPRRTRLHLLVVQRLLLLLHSRFFGHQTFRRRRYTTFAQYLLARIGHFAARLERLFALGAREALLVVRIAHR